MTDDHKKHKGLIAERQACKFLLNKGLDFLAHQFRCKIGEIDLIMKDQATLVFVEVRSRSSIDFGSPIDSINIFKQNKIIKTALYYLQTNNLHDKVDCRFDVIGIQEKNIEWIKNAFWLH